MVRVGKSVISVDKKSLGVTDTFYGYKKVEKKYWFCDSGAPWVRKFGNQVTVRPTVRPHHRHTNVKKTQLTGTTPQTTRGVFGGK